MRNTGKWEQVIFIIVFLIFLFQNCATMIIGTCQEIPVTSDPKGAKILVDGEEQGLTPLNLKLKKKKDHTIRIEHLDFNPVEIRIIRKTSGSLVLSIFGNVIWGCLGVVAGYIIGGILGPKGSEGWSFEGGWVGIVVGGVLAWGGSVLIDFSSGANYSLNPSELAVKLSKVGDETQSNIILIDEEQFENVKWIRIKYEDSNK